MTIKPQDIEALIAVFETSDWDELHLKIPEFEIFLSTDPLARAPGAAAAAPVVPVAPAAQAAGAASAAISSASTATPPTAPSAAVQRHWIAVKAPNLGTFYRAPKPGSSPFVEIGQAVTPETEICLIEVMKLFTTVKAGVAGLVAQVCVDDAVMVEFGDTLFYIEPG